VGYARAKKKVQRQDAAWENRLGSWAQMKDLGSVLVTGYE